MPTASASRIRWRAASSCSPATIPRPSSSCALTAEIHALRNPPLIMAVDHEGGRVQRFREGFTAIPPMRALGQAWDLDRGARARARPATRASCWPPSCALTASISRSRRSSTSTTAASGVIGDRALHSDPQADLGARARADPGLQARGHERGRQAFPGARPRARRFPSRGPGRRASLRRHRGARSRAVPAPRRRGPRAASCPPTSSIRRSTSRPAGFSPIWLKRVLRGELAFGGVDLQRRSQHGRRERRRRNRRPRRGRARRGLRHGAGVQRSGGGGRAAGRARAHATPPAALARLARMHGRARAKNMEKLRQDARYVDALRAIAGIGAKGGRAAAASDQKRRRIRFA